MIRVGVYLTDMSQFGAMNAAYGRHFAEPYPGPHRDRRGRAAAGRGGRDGCGGGLRSAPVGCSGERSQTVGVCSSIPLMGPLVGTERTA